MYRGRSCLLYVDSGSAVNGVSQELDDHVKLSTEPVHKPYQVTWVDWSKMIVSR